MRFQEMTWPLLRQVPRDATLVLAPIAACEQHSRHLPTFTDTLLVTAVAEGVEQRLPRQVLLLPTQWFGASSHHLRFGATLYCEFETSMVLSLRPELVRRDEIKDDPPPSEPALRGLYLCEDMYQRTDHGAVGYPERASADKGRACIKAAVERTVEVAQALLQRALP